MNREFFPGQKPDEQVKLVIRPHWLVMLPAILFLILAVVLPVIVLIIASAMALGPFTGSGRAITAVVLPSYYLAIVTWFFIRWVDYYLDAGIVTEERLIDIDQKGLFRRNIAELDCKMVQDISAEKDGVFQTVFDFGRVTVQTAGEHPNFIFNSVPHPDEVVRQIRETVDDRGGSAGPGGETASETPAPEPAPPTPPDPEPGPTPESPQPSTPSEPPVQTAETQAPEQPKMDATPQDIPREYES